MKTTKITTTKTWNGKRIELFRHQSGIGYIATLEGWGPNASGALSLAGSGLSTQSAVNDLRWQLEKY